MINQFVLDAICRDEFRRVRPYPWVNPKGILKDETFDRLIDCYPQLDMFEHHQGMARQYNQKPHDRFELVYTDRLNNIPAVWSSFIDVLRGKDYCKFVSEMLGRDDFCFKFQWQTSVAGGDLSPHTDSKNKLATHIFYLSNDDNWNSDWGGGTLILDDFGKIDHRSAPKLDQFDIVARAQTMNNYSLFFERSDHSWHALQELHCPAEAHRSIFSVIVYPDQFVETGIKFRLGLKPRTYFRPFEQN